jgi:protein phosphatase
VKTQREVVKVAWKSHVGLVRTGNEDFAHLDKDHLVFAVCDGMGGHQAGEVASMTASQILLDTFAHHKSEFANDAELALPRTLPPSGDLLVKGIRLANRAVYSAAKSDESRAGMGTTIVAVAFDGDMMSVAHVGDSRAYRLDHKAIIPLTTDHSWVSEMQKVHNLTREEASSVVAKNIITRALGVRDTVEVDYRLMKVNPGEIFVLCSDGLCGYADDDEIYQVARNHRENLQDMVDDLVQLVNDRGGSDNVTVIALHIGDVSESNLPEVELLTFPAEDAELVAYEDSIVSSMNAQRDERAMHESTSKQPNKFYLALIFASFVVLAIAVIYFSSGK